MKKRIIIGIVAIVICAGAGLGYWLLDGGKPHNYNLEDYVTVGEYEGLAYKAPENISVSDSELNRAINEDLAAVATMEDTEDGLVHKGDTVNIDYVGKINGEAFDGGTAQGSEIEIGNSGFIAGFDDGLIGAKVGETIDINVTFPDDYQQEDLAGKDAVFTVTINSAKVSTVPALKDYVKDETDFDSVAEYKASKENELKEEKESSQLETIKESLWDQVLDDSVVQKYPDREIQQYVKSGIEMAEEYAEAYQVEYEDLIEQSMGITAEEYEEQLAVEAQTSVKEQLVLYSIARREGLKITASEYEEKFQEMAESNGVDVDTLDENMKASYGDNYKKSLKESFLWEEVMNLIYEKGIAQ